MAEHRTITYPAEAVRDIADRLMDIDWNLPSDEAEGYALDIVTDVTNAVDKLRASERAAAEPADLFPCPDCGAEYGMNVDCDECLEHRRG